MEVVLLWLDDFEDFLFIAPLVWSRIRPSCLRIGLGAALMIPLSDLWLPAAAPELALWAVAAASLGLWLLGSCASACVRRYTYRPYAASA